MSSFFDLAMCCGGRRKPVEGDKVLDEDLFDRIRKLPDDDDPPSNVSWRNGEPHFNHTLPKSPSLASLRETTPPSTDTDADAELPLSPKELHLINHLRMASSKNCDCPLKKLKQWLLLRVGALGAMNGPCSSAPKDFHSLLKHGIVEFDQEHFSEAKTLFEYAIAQATSPLDLARACGNLGNVHQVFEEYDKCIVLYYHSIQLLRQAGEKQREANILHMLEQTLEELKHSDMIVSVLKREIELQDEGIYPGTYRLDNDKQLFSNALTEKLQYYEAVVQTPTLI